MTKTALPWETPVAEMNGHQLVAYYLMSSYLYYERDTQVLADDVFDAICVRLDKQWGWIQHEHKHLIHRESLRAGTGYDLKDYPPRIVNAALAWAAEAESLPSSSAR